MTVGKQVSLPNSARALDCPMYEIGGLAACFVINDSMDAPLSTFRSRRNATRSKIRFGIATEGRLLNSIEKSLQRTAVIIPARNEQDSLPLVLDDLPGVGVVIIAENGSTDSTAAIARQAGCEVVSEPIAGYGRACLAAMQRLSILCEDGSIAIDYVCFLDGDYSDHPEQIRQLLLPILHDEADFVLGSRLLGQRESGAMPPQAVWGNRLACFLMNRIWKTDYTDLGPFRIIRRKSLIDLDMQDLNFGWTVEMQVKAAVAQIRTIEVPVRYRRRVGVSKISGTVSGTIKAGYKILFTIAKYAWKTKLG